MYSVGDNVVYPHHGAGKVTKVERREVLGRQREYLTIQILHNHMTVMVPVENAERVGLRKVVKAGVVDQVVGVLRGSATEMPERWSRRYKHNDEKLKTGDIFEVAEVIRNLTIRYADKDIPTGEKQMLAKAKKILASEFVYARGLSEDAATAFLDDLLAGVHADAQEQAMVIPPADTGAMPAPLTVG